MGAFTWSGHFTWDHYRNAPKDRVASDSAPTPTMAGGLFAANRKFFWDIGGYDPGMIGKLILFENTILEYVFYL